MSKALKAPLWSEGLKFSVLMNEKVVHSSELDAKADCYIHGHQYTSIHSSKIVVVYSHGLFVLTSEFILLRLNFITDLVLDVYTAIYSTPNR